MRPICCIQSMAAHLSTLWGKAMSTEHHLTFVFISDASNHVKLHVNKTFTEREVCKTIKHVHSNTFVKNFLCDYTTNVLSHTCT